MTRQMGFFHARRQFWNPKSYAPKLKYVDDFITSKISQDITFINPCIGILILYSPSLQPNREVVVPIKGLSRQATGVRSTWRYPIYRVC